MLNGGNLKLEESQSKCQSSPHSRVILQINANLQKSGNKVLRKGASIYHVVRFSEILTPLPHRCQTWSFGQPPIKPRGLSNTPGPPHFIFYIFKLFRHIYVKIYLFQKLGCRFLIYVNTHVIDTKLHIFRNCTLSHSLQ